MSVCCVDLCLLCLESEAKYLEAVGVAQCLLSVIARRANRTLLHCYYLSSRRFVFIRFIFLNAGAILSNSRRLDFLTSPSAPSATAESDYKFKICMRSFQMVHQIKTPL